MTLATPVVSAQAMTANTLAHHVTERRTVQRAVQIRAKQPLRSKMGSFCPCAPLPVSVML